jgi:hypothetical protein
LPVITGEGEGAGCKEVPPEEDEDCLLEWLNILLVTFGIQKRLLNFFLKAALTSPWMRSAFLENSSVIFITS